MTKIILKVVQAYPVLQQSVLIDHLTTQVWSLIWDAGYMLGMTLQPGKSNIEEVRSVLGTQPLLEDRLILNSDGAKEISQPFLQSVREGLPRANQTWGKVFHGNAREFWGLNVCHAYG